jgi:uncharacterized protein (TIGR03663 family)
MRAALWSVFTAIILVALYLRVFQIDTRPPHSDEAVNFLFVQTVNRLGYYPYSHENYHGPLFFYFITGLVNLLGDSLLGLRACSILAGTLTVAALLAFARTQGWVFVILAALLCTFSPSLVFFSRYAIHEMLLVLATLVFAAALVDWAKSHRPAAIYAAALALAVQVTTKETFGISVFTVGLAFVTLGNWKEHWKAARLQMPHVMVAFLLFMVFVVGVFTGAFRWADGLREMFLAIPQWIGRSKSDVGHVKPFIYYLKNVLWQTEPALPATAVIAGLVLALAPFIRLLRGGEEGLSYEQFRPTVFFFVWFVSAFLVYSFVPYKTVWLIINVTLPGLLLLATLLSALVRSRVLLFRLGGLAAAAIVLALEIRSTLHFNFVELPLPGAHVALADSVPYGPANPFSYVHTAKGTLDLVADVFAYWKKKPDAKVLIGINGYFPLPYYFRNQPQLCAYTTVDDIDKAAHEYDIMVLDYYKDNWSNPDWSQRYYRLSDYAESYTYFRKLPEAAPAADGGSGSR